MRAEGHYAPECPDVSIRTNLQRFILSQSKDVLSLLRRGQSLIRAQLLIPFATGVFLVVCSDVKVTAQFPTVALSSIVIMVLPTSCLPLMPILMSLLWQTSNLSTT